MFYELFLQKQSFTNDLLLFHDGGRYHIETSSLFCSANQWTDFYMITASVIKKGKVAAARKKAAKVIVKHLWRSSLFFIIMITRKVKINLKDIQQSPDYNILYN